MRPDDSAFLAAIHAAPDDDAPRLVYADALVERGDPRGELIQLQCTLASVDEDDPRWHRMRRRERALLKEHLATWTKEVVAGAKNVEIELRRGFPEVVRGTAETLAAVAPALSVAAPLTVHLEAFAFERSVSPLLRSALFARARSLRLMSGRARVDISELAALAGPLPLSLFELDEVRLARSDLDALAQCRALGQLRELALSRCVLGKDSAGALEMLASPLRRFTVLSGKEPEAFVGSIVNGPAFQQLEVLGLCNTEIGDDGLAQIAKAGRLANLVDVDLRSAGLGAGALARLLEHLPATGLTRLLLGGNAISDAFAVRISDWSGSAGLTKLDLGVGIEGEHGGGDRGAQALAASPHLANLRSVVLTGWKVSRATERKLLASPYLAKARLYVGQRFLKRER